MTNSRQQPRVVDSPDGGWGWLIVVASFFVTFLMRGSEAAMTVVYVKFLDYFEAGSAVTSGIISVFTAANFSAGLIGAFLSKKYGFRKVAICGGALSFLSFLASSFANGVIYLYISLGIFAGSSFGLVLMPTMVSLGRYFKKRYVIASSLSLSGQGVGAFVMPPLCQFLLDHYGWRGTLMVFASISANMCVCAALLRPIHLITDVDERDKEVKMDSTVDDNSSKTCDNKTEDANISSEDALVDGARQLDDKSKHAGYFATLSMQQSEKERVE
ncbi:monocarboxylate transporter 13-like [Glandiceps talaboti]